MNTIFMKINGYDEVSHSLIVSFASDATKSQDPSDYPSFAYQPYTMYPDVTDPAQIPAKLAAAGIYETEAQERKEAFLSDPAKEATYKTLVGQTLTFNVADLLPLPTTTTTTTETA